MDTASSPWLNPPMRSSLAAVCTLFLALAATLHGQARWNFTDPDGNPSAVPTNITPSALTAANGGTLTLSSTSASAGYAGVSGGNNAALTARTGTFSATTSTYFEVTLTADPGFAVQIANVTVGTRSTGTGPLTLALYSSANNYTSALGTTTVASNSTWTLATLAASTAPALTLPAVTLRLYGYDGVGSAGAGNWRIDDLAINATAVPAPTIATPPSPVAIVSGQSASFTVNATGTGTLSYQWRRNATAVSGNASAQTATLTLPNVLTGATGDYDVVVTDSLASTTSAAAALTVNKAPATLAPQAHSR